jgi:low affinity Fe/Cu permease
MLAEHYGVVVVTSWYSRSSSPAVTGCTREHVTIEWLATFFSRLAHWTSQQCGRAHTFALACVAIVVWAATGPLFNFSDTWQLVINTGTTIVTFLMVFLIQNTQNRDAAAVQMKLNELIRTNQNARNSLLTLEDLTEDQLRQIKATFAALAVGGTGLPGEIREVRKDLAQAGQDLEEAETKLARAQVQTVAFLVESDPAECEAISSSESHASGKLEHGSMKTPVRQPSGTETSSTSGLA